VAQFEFLRWLAEWILAQEEFEFDWDDGNSTKSLQKHGIPSEEAEGLFHNREFLVPLGVQVLPKTDEPRFGIFSRPKKRSSRERNSLSNFNKNVCD
jgi:hypothetical protein